MVDAIFQSDSYQLARKLLDASALRQDAIAANLANAETPGYHRVDLPQDFSERLKTASASIDRSEALASVQPSLTEDVNARSVRPDGNNVDLEKEMLTMDRNAMDYSYLTEFVSQNIKQLKIAITGNAS